MKEEKYILKYSKIVLNQGTWSGICNLEEEFDCINEAIGYKNLYGRFIYQQDRNLDSDPVQIKPGNLEICHWKGNKFSCLWEVGEIVKRTLETVG